MLIDHLGNQKGVMPLVSALSIAQDNGLDLVQISEGKDYPVCKILDFGKYLYQKQKKWELCLYLVKNMVRKLES